MITVDWVGHQLSFSIFKMFFTTALVASIVEQTNIYARQVLGDAAERKWTDVTEDDMWAFFGFMILMGINKLPHLHHYWSQDPYFHYNPVADRISWDRFFAISRFLHFTGNGALSSVPDNEKTLSHTGNKCLLSDPTFDQLRKVRPVILAVLAACRANYWPHMEKVIDEAMVGFKG